MLARSMEQIRKNERAKEEEGKILNMERRKVLCQIDMEELINLAIEKEKRVQCWFFKVPDPIRRVSEGSYDPRLVCFGLYGRGEERWAHMEKIKLEVASIVLKELRTAHDDEKLKIHNDVTGEKEKIQAIWNHICDKVVPVGRNESGQYIWKLYSDSSPDLSFPVVRHLLVLDAIFLVSFMLFLRIEPRSKSFGLPGFQKYEALRGIFTRAGILCNLNIIASDIWLFENQIPLLLIRRTVREMYIPQEDEEKMTFEQKNADAERAFEKLVKASIQRVLRVLPGNYKRRSGKKTEETTTSRWLKTEHLKKCRSLLECLYRLVCSMEDPRSEAEASAAIDPTEPIFPEEEEQPRDAFQPMLKVVSLVTRLMRGRKKKPEEEETEEKTTNKSRGLVQTKLRPSRAQSPFGEQDEDDEEEGIQLVPQHAMAQPYLRSESLISGGSTSNMMYMRSPEPSTDVRRQSEEQAAESSSRVPGSESPQVQGWPVPNYDQRVQMQGLGRETEITAASPSENRQQPGDGKAPSPFSTLERVSTKRKRVSLLEPPSVVASEPGPTVGIELARFMPKYFDYNYRTGGMNPTSMHAGLNLPETRAVEDAEDVPCFKGNFLSDMCARACEGPKIDSFTLPTVTSLREVGIRVEGDSSPGFNCKVELKDSSLWGNATLHISPLNVDHTTERFLRNLVAFEIVSTSEHRLLTYLQCLDDLINTQQDVCMLKEGKRPVILNSSLDERDVATLFNRMLLNCTVYQNQQLHDIRSKVRNYYLQQWRRGWTEFKERYGVCSKPWVAISLLAGFLVLGMTGIQTVYTVIGFYM
ncbi:hypothetical protein R1flu_026705 [Riccia fluitans]|uniref:Uncharacterized protein n=1 Tax=Riccia fluitans TaxID=41844 RepID=A0ABD1XGQ8_9MARC